MDTLIFPILTDKSKRLRSQNQYTSNFESGSTKTKIKHWVELFFGVKVRVMNSHRLPKKGNNLIYEQGRKTGHNSRGIITSRHREGGHKRLYRQIDFRQTEKDIYDRIVTIEYDPN